MLCCPGIGSDGAVQSMPSSSSCCVSRSRRSPERVVSWFLAAILAAAIIGRGSRSATTGSPYRFMFFTSGANDNTCYTGLSSGNPPTLSGAFGRGSAAAATDAGSFRRVAGVWHPRYVIAAARFSARSPQFAPAYFPYAVFRCGLLACCCVRRVRCRLAAPGGAVVFSAAPPALLGRRRGRPQGRGCFPPPLFWVAWVCWSSARVVPMDLLILKVWSSRLPRNGEATPPNFYYSPPKYYPGRGRGRPPRK